MTAARVCSLSELEPGTARRVEVDGVPVALVRIGDRVHAVNDVCSHADVSLAEGEVDVEACEIECWQHGSTFSLTTGEPQCLPATKPVAVYGVRVVDDDVIVDVPRAGETP